MAGLGFKEKLLTKDELAKFKESPIYLAILGKVYDVTEGKRHYCKGAGYEGFSGRDGTRAFITGDFTEAGLIEDIRGLTLPEFLGLHEWQQKYDKDYTYIGKVIGEYYDEKGQPTETLIAFNHHLKEAFAEKDLDALDMSLFPPCNSEWTEATGKRIWCTEWSGGIRRSWVGLPREYLRAGKTQPRCACVKDIGPPSSQPDSKNHKNNGDLDNPSLKVYSGCDPKAVSCSFPS
ncbi:hypothetical protein LOTGIDRAFT_116983 [Lottia gigantea]|uniref:Cytochrome b5 heme-binding domain-containing protein n=1 Tax=Lottia gigantea TaxID=225164 RepID=V4AF67_LOTGI|nr:hypothetical protein LOTGIDRAFT_116983 [Lottia gigantea]ESO95497.1 hypothetical protein LOTGIDRAFT_116983 [Lottia gigantea]